MESRQSIRTRPQQMYINTNGQRMAIIDTAGILQLYEFSGTNDDNNTKLQFEKKDVWDFKWSLDDPLGFVYMEKSRMNIVKDTTQEDPIITDCYPCSFQNMTVKSIMLDEIMKIPDGELKESENYIQIYESTVLKQIKQQFNKNNNQLESVY